MPVFSLKKFLESPDQGEKEVEINVPEEVFTKILLMLDGGSLHRARQVSREWNSFIEEQVLGSVEGRREMERTLQRQWRAGVPGKMELTIGDLVELKVLSLSDEVAIIGSESKVRVFSTRDGAEMMEFSCLKSPDSEDFLTKDALLTKDVLLVVGIDEDYNCHEVLAWNIDSRKKIFYMRFYTGYVLDQYNNQVMVGGDTRLEIEGGKDIKTIQAPLPGKDYVLAFSHPYYLTGYLAPITLWKVDGTAEMEISVPAG